MNSRRFLLLVASCFVALALTATAQPRRDYTEEELAEGERLLAEGIRLMEEGAFDESWKVLEEGRLKFPGHSHFRYEQGYLRYMQKEYFKALAIGREIINAPDAGPHTYQLLGNSFDMTGDPDSAVATYRAGLERFPEAGNLYLELGVMSLKKESYPEAMDFFEQGINAAPAFASNYFHAANMFLTMTEERGWGLLYGEIFLNLEPMSQRSDVMRQLLFDGYNDAINVISKDSLETHLFKNIVMSVDTATMDMLMPFSMFYSMGMSVAAVPTSLRGDGPRLSIGSIHAIRSEFLTHWHAQGYDTLFHIDLFARQEALRKAGLFEAYDYFLLSAEETEDEVGVYFSANEEKIRSLAAWFSENPMIGDASRAFSITRTKGISMKEMAGTSAEMPVPKR